MDPPIPFAPLPSLSALQGQGRSCTVNDSSPMHRRKRPMRRLDAHAYHDERR